MEWEHERGGWKPNARGFYFELARAARDNGYAPLVPISTASKGCFVPGWPRFRLTPPTNETMRAWVKDDPECGWGYAHDCKLCCIDIDVLDEHEVGRHMTWF